ncbi:unnamed protein product [Lota lota]
MKHSYFPCQIPYRLFTGREAEPALSAAILSSRPVEAVGATGRQPARWRLCAACRGTERARGGPNQPITPARRARMTPHQSQNQISPPGRRRMLAS